jgi:hypothetical protein
VKRSYSVTSKFQEKFLNFEEILQIVVDLNAFQIEDYIFIQFLFEPKLQKERSPGVFFEHFLLTIVSPTE